MGKSQTDITSTWDFRDLRQCFNIIVPWIKLCIATIQNHHSKTKTLKKSIVKIIW